MDYPGLSNKRILEFLVSMGTIKDLEGAEGVLCSSLHIRTTLRAAAQRVSWGRGVAGEIVNGQEDKQDGQAWVREQEGRQVADVREADLTCLDHWGEVSDK